MKTIGIASYALKVQKKTNNKDNQYVNLGGADEHGFSVKELFFEFLNSKIRNHSVNTDYSIVLQAEEKNIIKKDSVIKGIINFGDYGYSASGYNIVENKISYHRNRDDSELIPYYFLAYLPDGRDTGILLVQRFGSKGIFTALKQAVSSFFDTKCNNYKFVFRPQVPFEVFKYLRDGSLKSIKIIRYVAPDDISETIKNLGFETEEGILTIEFKAKRKGTLLKPSWLTNFNRKNGFYEIDQEKIPIEGEVQISVDYLGKTRKIRFDDPQKISPYIDATDDLDIMNDGHPSFDSIDRYCENLLDQLLKEMGSQRHV